MSVLTYFNHQYNCIQKDEKDDEVCEERACFLLRKHRVEFFLIRLNNKGKKRTSEDEKKMEFRKGKINH